MNNFKVTGVHELTAAEMDNVSGGFLFKFANFVLDNGFLKETGKGYGDIIKGVADAAAKKGGGTPK